MTNLYITVEPEKIISAIISNISSYYILDVQQIQKEQNLDWSKPANRYLLNNIITDIIKEKTRFKKVKGIIYINNQLTENVITALKRKFEKNEIGKVVLIDDGEFPKLNFMYTYVDEVLFYQRFKRLKIIE